MKAANFFSPKIFKRFFVLVGLTSLFLILHGAVALTFPLNAITQQLAISLTWCFCAVGLFLLAERPNQHWIRTLAGWAALLTSAKILVLDWSLWGFTLQSLCFDKGGTIVMVRWAVHAALWSLWLVRAFYKQHSKIRRVRLSASVWVALLLPWIFALIESSLLCSSKIFRIHLRESWLALLWIGLAVFALNTVLKQSLRAQPND